MDDIVATNDDEMVEILSCTPIRYPGQETSIICVSTWHEEVDSQSRGDKVLLFVANICTVIPFRKGPIT